MKTNKSVLVSGGTGFIGSHTAVELINAGYSVVIVDNLSNSEATVIDGIERITGQKIPFENVDTCDLKALRGVFERHDFDSVIHFAAFKAVGESVSEPLKYYQNNLVSFMNILELMKEFGRHNVVFSSSATVYGDADELPVTEQSPRKPATSPYGNTKQMCEDILRGLSRHPRHCPALFQPHRRPPHRHHRRAAPRRPQQPRAVHHADGRRHPQGAVHLRQ